MEVLHEVRAGTDEIEFQFELKNHGNAPADLEWFQPACIRVDRFTGRNQANYIERSFIFTKQGLAMLDQIPRAEDAVYRGGQVYVPAGIDRNDVNPRPISPVTPVNDLIGCFSADGKMLLAVASEPTHELFQGVIVCLHNDPRIGGLQPGETKRIRQKVYFLPNDPAALLARYERDFPKAKSRAAAGRREIVTVAGTGQAGYSGDGAAATQARLANPYGLVRGPDGSLYVCEVDNHVIRRVAADGTISTIAGSGKRGYAGDGGPALQAELNEPYELRFDRAGNLFFVEMKNHLVRRVDARTRIISTVAGTGKPGFGGDGGPATHAAFNQPHSIQFDARGDLFLCDIGNHRVRKVDLQNGIVTTFAGTGAQEMPRDGAKFDGAPLFGPRALDFDREGNLWLALREGNAVYKFDLKAGTLHHVAGTGKKGFTGHGGPAKLAALSGPKGLSLGPDGNVYLADTESHSIRMIDVRHGTIELIAGTGERGDGPDGDPLNCRLARPHGVFVDADGSVFVGDSEAHRVRVLRARP